MFSHLDLPKGYNQLKIDEKSQGLLGIVTHKGIFQFTVLSRLEWKIFLRIC